VQWSEFTSACPEFAQLAERRFRADELVILGTVRRDGSPRVSPCEIDFAADRLLLGMMWRSRKALDLLRDPRLAVHSVPSDRMNRAGDVKLYGRAVEEADPEVREGYCRVIHERIDWAPTEPYHLFSLDVVEAGFMRFSDQNTEVWRWSAERGLQKEDRPKG